MMNNQDFFQTKEILDTIKRQELFQGNNKFYIVKHSNTNDVYIKNLDSIIPLYTFDNRHTFFLQALPFITDKLPSFKSDLMEYYDCTSSPNYSLSAAKSHLLGLFDFLSSMHPFFRKSNTAYIYIRTLLYKYFINSTNYRFVNHIRSSIPEESIFDEAHLRIFKKSFLPLEHNIFIKLFIPLYTFLYPAKNKQQLDSLVERFWEDHYIPDSNRCTEWFIKTFSKKVSEKPSEEPSRHFFENFSINDFFPHSITLRLEKIANIFSEYFFLSANIQSLSPQCSVFQEYALLLTNHPYIKQMLEECTFYSTYQSLDMIIQFHLAASNPQVSYIALDDSITGSATDELYKQIKELLPSHNSEIFSALNSYYPPKLEKYKNVEITEVHSFEHLFIFELLDIMKENTIIKRCPIPDCNSFFITTSKKQVYCNLHKGKRTSYTKSYTKKKLSTPYNTAYLRYYNCFSARITRNKQFKKNLYAWREEASDLLQKSSDSHDSFDTFIQKLNKISMTHGFEPPRGYNTSNPK